MKRKALICVLILLLGTLSATNSIHSAQVHIDFSRIYLLALESALLTPKYANFFVFFYPLEDGKMIVYTKNVIIPLGSFLVTYNPNLQNLSKYVEFGIIFFYGSYLPFRLMIANKTNIDLQGSAYWQYTYTNKMKVMMYFSSKIYFNRVMERTFFDGKKRILLYNYYWSYQLFQDYGIRLTLNGEVFFLPCVYTNKEYRNEKWLFISYLKSNGSYLYKIEEIDNVKILDTNQDGEGEGIIYEYEGRNITVFENKTVIQEGETPSLSLAEFLGITTLLIVGGFIFGLFISRRREKHVKKIL